jgi:hypothetical protein
MEDYKYRLISESEDLDKKIASLEVFITTDEFRKLKWKIRMHLRLQLFFMRRYFFWLAQRMMYTCTIDDYNEYRAIVDTTNAAENTKKPKSKKKPKKKKSNE